MNTAVKTGLFLAGALIAYNAFAKGTALTTLNFYPKKVNGIRMEGITPVLTFSLAIQNTSNQTMTLRSIAGNLFANGYLIGNVSSYVPVRINANAETIVLLTVRLSLLGVVQDIIRAIDGGGFKQELSFESYANVDRYQIPINIKYTVG